MRNCVYHPDLTLVVRSRQNHGLELFTLQLGMDRSHFFKKRSFRFKNEKVVF